MKQYLDLIEHIIANGDDRMDRTGVGTRSIFGYQMRFDLRKGFPLVTTKFTSFKTIMKELVWYLKGEGNIKFLNENGVSIWDEWADSSGHLGPVYGVQYRHWKQYNISSYTDILEASTDGSATYYGATVKVNEIDQIKELISNLKTNPASRRHIVTAWNVSDIDQMKLPPCHMTYQFHVSTKGKLSCQLYQRSNDIFLGNPYNVACYAALTHIIAKICGYAVGELIITIGDAHIYHNHMDQVAELLTRTPYKLPTLEVPSQLTDIDQLTSGEITWDDFTLHEYTHHPRLSAPVAV